jgi:hypothetical protein
MIDNISKIRRPYPKNNFGGKDEWHGLIIHQNEMNSEISQIEKNIKQIKTKNFV